MYAKDIDFDYIDSKAKDFNIVVRNRFAEQGDVGSINFEDIKLPFDRFLDESDIEYLNFFIKMRRDSNTALYGKPYRIRESDGRAI